MAKTIRYEDFDQAVKTAYSLGKLDGEAGVRNLLDDMRMQLALMLTTNKELHRVLQTEHNAERAKGAIRLSQTATLGILRSLEKLKKDTNCFWPLRRKYEKATGKKYKGAGQ